VISESNGLSLRCLSSNLRQRQK